MSENMSPGEQRASDADSSDTLAGSDFEAQLGESTDELDAETGRYRDARDASEGGYESPVAAPDEQPDTQGDTPLVADLGEDGEGDLGSGDI